jgi:hypothetical protein
MLPKMKRRQIEPTRLVGLQGLPELAGTCCEADGTLRIGAGETLATICANPEVARSASALAMTGASNLHIYAAMCGESLDDFLKTRNTKVLYSVSGKEGVQHLAWNTPTQATP